MVLLEFCKRRHFRRQFLWKKFESTDSETMGKWEEPLLPLLPGGRRRRRCTVDTDLHCLLRLGVVSSGGGGLQGAAASYHPAEAESVCFPSQIHSYDNTTGP